MPKRKKDEDKEAKKAVTALDQIRAHLADKDHKDFHYNDIKQIFYKISTGSLNLDLETGGGFTCGLHRFSGPSESGKTSCALSIARNFQKEFWNNGMVIFVRAEGRLSQTMIDRAGIDQDPSRWFVYDSNVYESVFELIKKLISNNEEDRRYMFIIDSIDALCRKADLEKGFGESDQVAGGALLSSVFLKKMALPIVKMSHMLVFTSQIRSKVDVNGRGGSSKPQNSGGHAWRHYSNFVLEFQERYTDDIMYENPSAKTLKDKGRPLGHDCKITFRKSVNEKTGVTMSYPIIYGRKAGKSVWVEREIMDLLFAWGFLEKNSSWINVGSEITSELEKHNLTFIEKIQGADKFCAELEKNPEVTAVLFEFCKDQVTALLEG